MSIYSTFYSRVIMGVCEHRFHCELAKEFVITMVDHLSKMIHFMPCHKKIDTLHIVDLYFREVVCFHGVLKIITSIRDVKFLGDF